MAGHGVPGGERAQEVPQERQVEVMQGPPDREIVQLARGQRIKIVGLAHALHPTGPWHGGAPAWPQPRPCQPRRTAVSSRPRGGEPSSSSALWKRCRDETDPPPAPPRSPPPPN